jgi:hypothetical protein
MDLNIFMGTIVVYLIFVGFIIFIYYFLTFKPVQEHYNGALQSLYSNRGIQDTYLTNTDPNDMLIQDYMPWDLPTRQLNRIIFYPISYNGTYLNKYYPF